MPRLSSSERRVRAVVHDVQQREGLWRKDQGGRGTHLLVALVISPLATHPVRVGAPFLRLIETISNIWELILCVCFIPYITWKLLADLFLLLFRRLWPPSIS